MKNKTKLLISLLLVFVGIGLTYAIYNTSVGGTANVSTANWLIKIKTGSNFDNQNGIDVSGGANNIELGSCDKLAPGGSCILPFRVDATVTEVDTILTVGLGNNVSGATLEELEAAGINLKISDGNTEGYTYVLDMGSYKDLNLVINWDAGDEEDDIKALADVNIANKMDSITIPVDITVKQRFGDLGTVKFNSNGGSNVNDLIVMQGVSTLLPQPTKQGYDFVGWFGVSNEAENLFDNTATPHLTKQYIRGSDNTIVAHNDFAIYKLDVFPNVEYTISNLKGISESPGYVVYDENGNNLLGASYNKATSLTFTTPAGASYILISVVTNPNSSRYDLNVLEFTGLKKYTNTNEIESDITLYAIWTEKKYTVEFNSYGGSEVEDLIIQEGNTISELPTTTKEGYNFLGWYTSLIGGELLTTSTPILSDITYYAHWEIKRYTVTFNSDGGSNVNDMIVTPGEATVSFPQSTKQGHDFVGWFTYPYNLFDKTSTPYRSSYYVRGNGSNVSHTEFSIYKINILPNVEYTISGMTGGSTSPGYAIYNENNTRIAGADYNGAKSMTFTSPANSSYILISVVTQTGSSRYDKETYEIKGGKEYTNTGQITEDTTLYAVWTERKFTLTFDSNGGSSVEPIQVLEGGTLDTIPTPTYGVNRFMGWFDSNNQLLTTSTQILANTTYTARWDEPYLGRVVYFDPVSTSTCNSTSFDETAVANSTSTCYKWRIIEPDESKQNVTIQLDHNLVNITRWSSKSSNSSGPELLSELATETSEWGRVDPLDDYSYDTSAASYNYGVLSCDDGICKITKNNVETTIAGTSDVPVRARVITSEEVASIASIMTNNSTANTWNISTQGNITLTNSDNKDLSWLIENTRVNTSSGATSNIYGETNTGYWVLTPANTKSSYAFAVSSSGAMSAAHTITFVGTTTGGLGIRPVITISKSLLN